MAKFPWGDHEVETIQYHGANMFNSLSGNLLNRLYVSIYVIQAGFLNTTNSIFYFVIKIIIYHIEWQLILHKWQLRFFVLNQSRK